jgi:hypothetical protein
LLGLLALAACNKGDDQAKVDEAKRDAEAKVAEADREANEKKAQAEKDVAEAKAKAEKAREEARSSFKKDIDAADRKAADLKTRLVKAKGKVKLNAEAAAAELDKRRAVVERDMQGLTSASGDAWDTLKAQTEKDIDAVEEAVSSLDKTLG